MGKKLVAARDAAGGPRAGRRDLAPKSPADGGLPPYELHELLGGTLKRALAEDEAILTTDVVRMAATAAR